MTEIELYDLDGNEIIPIGIAADSIYGTGYDTSKLIDKKFNTLWSSKNTDDLHWLEFTFLNPVYLNKIKIYPRSGIEHGVPNIMSFYASEMADSWYSIGYFENLKDTWIDENTA